MQRRSGLGLLASALGVIACSLLAPNEGDLTRGPRGGRSGGGLDGGGADGGTGDDGAGGSTAGRGTAGQNAGGRDQPPSGGAGTGASGDPGTAGACAGTPCGDECADLDDDANHCGACDRACRPGYGCELGRCGDEIVRVAAGIVSSCALLRAGEMHCWGENQLGQLGDGSVTGTDQCAQNHACRPAAAPVMLNDAPLAGIVDIALSLSHACAVDGNGAAWCWGENSFGQLGRTGGESSCTTASGAKPCRPVPERVGLPGGVRATRIRTGLYYSCALTDAGDVYCWGQNNFGQLALPLSTVSTSVPTKVAGLPRPARELSLALQGDVSGVLLDDGAIWAWGNNLEGGLGHAPTSDPACGASRCSFTPEAVLDAQAQPFTAESVSIGRLTSCAVKDGAVWCWGANRFGVLGTGTAATTANPVPQRVPGLSEIRSLALTDLTALATDANGVSWAWGRNNYGSVGDGTIGAVSNGCIQACRPAPTRIAVADLVETSVAAVVLGIDAQGALWLWGHNGSAQLGHLPGAAGDVTCGAGASPAPCNPTPGSIAWLP